MRICSACLVIALAGGCLGPQGPELPPNVGASHVDTGNERPVEPAPPPAAEPVAVGTPVWVNLHDSGFYFHAVVVEQREGQHRVIYADGTTEWVGAAAMVPDTIGEEARVQVRAHYDGDFATATVGRRLGRALYVRLAGGTERWTTLAHVRFQGDDRNRTALPPAAPNPATAGEVGSEVLVNYQLQGLRFAATVTAQREDGRLHVVYVDGETEWIDPVLAVPDDIGQGSILHVRRTWEPPEWVRGRVHERIGSALRVELDDGGTAWTSMFRVRVPVPEPPAPVVTAPPEPAPTPAPRRRRRPAAE